MRLPQHLQHFPEPTLIVLTDHVQGRFWLAHLETLEQIDQLALPHELKSDREGSFVNTDHGGSTSGPEPSDREHSNHWIHLMTEKIETVCQAKNIKQLDLVMRPDLLHALRAHLPQSISILIKTELGVDLMKMHILETLDRLLKG